MNNFNFCLHCLSHNTSYASCPN